MLKERCMVLLSRLHSVTILNGWSHSKVVNALSEEDRQLLRFYSPQTHDLFHFCPNKKESLISR
uniref:Uncharacterized protein n=1 Tax=Parascaris equorum TaxID=6256 RepID=A0A914R597_PAREQ